ncbi:MAG: ShlB/FhaC/HecB family hemolysin secretion/activation protein [Pseudomonadota bacterium]
MKYIGLKFGLTGRSCSSARVMLVLALHALVPAVLAQTVPPASVDPSRLRDRLDLPPETERPLEQRETNIQQGSALPDSMKSVRVTLKTIRITGATALTADVLQAAADSYTGREISGNDILELASSLTAMYRNAGYILSVVVVPPQSLESGLLTLHVVEGYIGNVTVRAGDGVSDHVRASLAEAGERIRASRPINASVLERYLLIANDFPGVTLRSVLAPSQLPGAADLTLVASLKKTEGFVAVDNYGSRYLGPMQAFVGVGVNQLLGINDQWRFTAAGTGNSEMSFAQIWYSQVLNAEGLKLSAIVSSARTRPGDSLKPFDVRGNADTYSLGLSYPLLRTRNESLLLRGTYEHADIHTDILGTRVVQDHVRALRLGLGWRVLDRLDGQNTLDVDFSQGLGGTQASDLLKSRVGADGVFSKLTFDYERSQPLGPGTSLVAGVGGQWANTPLLSSEQYALGGRRFGRGYEPAEVTGERALALRIEPRYTAAFNRYGLRSWQFFGFYDIGRVWKLGTPTPGVASSPSLASAGMGARLFFEKNMFGVIDAAWPLTRPLASNPAKGKSVRLLASLVLRF